LNFWYRLNELLKWVADNSVTNLINGKRAILVDAQSIESTYSEEITDDSDSVLISPSSGNKITVKDVYMFANGNHGQINIDFNNDGAPIARLYSSQFKRLSAAALTKTGDVDQEVEFSMEDSLGADDKVFVLINYIEEEGD